VSRLRHQPRHNQTSPVVHLGNDAVDVPAQRHVGDCEPVSEQRPSAARRYDTGDTALPLRAHQPPRH